MTRVVSNAPEGTQLSILGGTVYLKKGQAISLNDMQLKCVSVQNHLRTGVLSVVTPVAEEPAPIAAAKPAKAAKAKAAPVAEEPVVTAEQAQ